VTARSATVGCASRSKSAYGTLIVTVCVPAWKNDPLARPQPTVDVDRKVVQVAERRHSAGLAVGEPGSELPLGGQTDRFTADDG